MSEEYDTPVFLRLTTRIAHARSLVEHRGARRTRPCAPTRRTPCKYVMMPGMATRAPPRGGGARGAALAKAANAPAHQRRAEMRDTAVGIITSGVCYQYVR